MPVKESAKAPAKEAAKAPAKDAGKAPAKDAAKKAEPSKKPLFPASAVRSGRGSVGRHALGARTRSGRREAVAARIPSSSMRSTYCCAPHCSLACLLTAVSPFIFSASTRVVLRLSQQGMIRRWQPPPRRTPQPCLRLPPPPLPGRRRNQRSRRVSLSECAHMESRLRSRRAHSQCILVCEPCCP